MEVIYPVTVMVVPFLEQSHLSQLLRLSCLISSRDIPVHYISSSTHNRQVRLRCNQLDMERVHFHDLPINFPSPPPDPNSISKKPTHLAPVYRASSQLRQPFNQILHDISATSKRIVIIHDYLTKYVIQDAVSIANTETYAYCAISAFSLLSFRDPEKLKRVESGIEIPEFPPPSRHTNSANIEIPKFESTGMLINTSRLIEPSYIDLLHKVGGFKNQWTVAPLHPVTKHRNPDKKDTCLNWLDKQEPKSVIYVSFGNTTTLKDEQIQELAMGLEQSKVKFIWVLRNADRGDIFKEDDFTNRIELPEGFEKRNEDTGLIVRGWAPQLEILGHPSIGGFMSHCGWNSCMESMTMGAPIAAWPMHTDQPYNAVLVCDVLKAGVLVKKWTHMEEVVEASFVRDAVRTLMSSEEGDEMRNRARSIGDRFDGEDGGFGIELESFLAHIAR